MAIPEVRPLQVGPGLLARMILLGSWVIPTSNVMDKGRIQPAASNQTEIACLKSQLCGV